MKLSDEGRKVLEVLCKQGGMKPSELRVSVPGVFVSETLFEELSEGGWITQDPDSTVYAATKAYKELNLKR